MCQGRRSFYKAIGILEFACRILAENSSLLLLGFATLAGIVIWTWVWMAMFTRVFLGGHFSSSRSFVIDTSTWWLGAFFIMVYLWALAVMSGIQRSVTAATVSQWYFQSRELSAGVSWARSKESWLAWWMQRLFAGAAKWGIMVREKQNTVVKPGGCLVRARRDGCTFHSLSRSFGPSCDLVWA
jgi:Plasma-membrane choline transporter